MLYPNEKQFVRLSAEYDLVPVYKEILADTETPVSVLERFASKGNIFLLESMEGGEKWGRYSFLGIQPEQFLEIDHSKGMTDKFKELRNAYSQLRIAPIEGLPRFFGGTVGFISYEGIGEFEKMPTPSVKDPEIQPVSRFVKADKIIVFDNVRHTVKIVICANTKGSKPQEQYKQIVNELDSLTEEIRKPFICRDVASHPPAEFKSNMTKDEFVRMVEKAKKYIYNGDIIQVVLSQRFSAKCNVPPVQIYRALRFLNPSPYTFYLKVKDQILIGSSPEVMVRLTGNKVELRPIAGTRPRGQTEQEDRKLADELLVDEKEKAEHVMLVDLGRNDIGRIAEKGSVQVTEFMMIERYSHVMHMVSHVEGILKKEYDAYDVIKATFPAGTLTGAPKIRAMQIIHELEPSARGIYGGAVGYISYSGNMDLAITIRTIEVAGNSLSIQAGAGIVFDSDPQREYDETCYKSKGMIKAVEMAANGLEVS